MPRLLIPLTLAGCIWCQFLQAHPATNAVPPAPGANRSTPKAAQLPPQQQVSEKKVRGYPFRGKLAAVDLTLSTIRIGKSTYWITPQTKITKNGNPARLSDGVIGEAAVGYARKEADGRAMAASLRFGEKVETGSTKAPPVSTTAGKKT